MNDIPSQNPDEIMSPLSSDIAESVLEPETNITRSTVPAGYQLAIALILLSGVFGISYVPWLNTRGSAPTTVEKSVRSKETPANVEKTVVNEPNIEASSAFVWDVRDQRALFNKNASAQLPLASLTKLMTALVATEALGKKNKVAMTLDAINQDGSSDFRDGEQFDPRALTDFTLVSSSNDGAYALAAAAGAILNHNADPTKTFIAAMNARAEALGLSQTYFTNPTGLDASDKKSGSYGSARDMAFLMEYLLENRPEIIEATTQKLTSVDGSSHHSATNTNEVIDKIPGLIGTKTGYTDLAGGNLVVAFDAGLNHPVVVSVLGSTREGRFKDVLSLINYAQHRISNNNSKQ